MSTFLFNEIIFGPVKSRRLGISLGINLLPTHKKVCTFDCIYCECGFNSQGSDLKTTLPKREEVYQDLELKLQKMNSEGELPDVITFAGNGEPTIHPDFSSIIDDTIVLRDKYCPKARIAVLSNATVLHKNAVKSALLKIDDNILKLDGGLPEVIQLLDQPSPGYKMEKVIEQLKSFNGQLIIQTMFIKGVYQGKDVNNTFEENLDAWLSIIQSIKPKSVMIYTISRDTPVEGLEKISIDTLEAIAKKVNQLGIETQVSG